MPNRPKATSLQKNRKTFLYTGCRLVCFWWVFFAFSCHEKECIYHEYKPIHEKGWDATDTVFFNIPITDTLSTYSVELDIRNTTLYPYKDVYIMVETGYGNKAQKVISSDLICYPLADQKGKWMGTGWGTLLQNSRPLKTLYFTHSGSLTYKIYHKMNDSSLRGIRDVGIKIIRE